MQELFKYYVVNCKYEWEGLTSDARFYFGSLESAKSWILKNKKAIRSFEIDSIAFHPCDIDTAGQLFRTTTIELVDESFDDSNNLLDLISASDYIINRKVIIQSTDNDRRRKLSNREIDEIRHYYDKHIFTIRELSQMYNVSYATIKYHVNETFRYELNKQRKNWINRSIKNRPSDRNSELANYKRNLISNGSDVIIR